MAQDLQSVMHVADSKLNDLSILLQSDKTDLQYIGRLNLIAQSCNELISNLCDVIHAVQLEKVARGYYNSEPKIISAVDKLSIAA